MSRKASASMRPYAHPLPIGLFHLDPTEQAATVVLDEVAADPPAGDPSPQTSRERTFSQADVDRLLARQKRVFLSGEEDDKFNVPRELRELREKALEFDRLQEANQTELERERVRAELAEERIKLIEAEAKETRLRAALVAEAAKPGRNVVDVEAALALINRDDLDIDDSGVPTNIAEAMDSLLKAKPFLVAVHGGADLGARDHGGIKQVTEAELKTMTAEQIDQAHREGRLVKVLGR